MFWFFFNNGWLYIRSRIFLKLRLFAKNVLHENLEHLWPFTPMLLFKCLVSLLSFAVVLFCSPLNKSTNSLAHLLKPGLLQTLAISLKNSGCQTHWQEKTIFLLYSSRYFGIGIFLDLPGTGITNSSCLLLSVCHQALNTPDHSRGCSACGAGNQLWARLYFVHDNTLLSNVSFLSSEHLLVSLI